ncbi:MAG TPA: cytochrome c3 family protein [Gemmatimonadales bacterium]|nr:cytochrome c3 family protein [Gemmatimonadales bacterium]
MSVIRRLLSLSVLGLVAAVGFLGACTDEEIVYRNVNQPFNPPPDEASGFLGYYTADEQQTTCGNCHVGTHSQWLTSGHTGAWAALVQAGQEGNPDCQVCHAVSGNGNATTGDVGILAVNDAAYYDVQCESCHGPGFDHVQEPDNPANLPLARADVTVDPGTGRVLDIDASCASCHGVSHGPRSLAGDWLISGHAALNTSPASNPSCRGCHEGRAVMLRFQGQTSNYIERDSLTGQYQYLSITCTSCHDPHGSPNSAMLRAPIESPDLQTNLCMSCHNRGTAPAASFSNGDRGAHASQGPILVGMGAGYIPAGFAFDTVQAYGTHASGANPRLCAGCHVNAFEGTAEVEYSGHEFLPIPCIDANGDITDDQECGYGPTERSWAACTAAGCHGDNVVASTAFNNQRQVVQNLIDIIWINNDVNAPGGSRPMVSAGDGGYLGEIFATDPTQFTKEAGTEPDPYVLTPAEGAIFNAQMLAEVLYDHQDGSKGIHNPFYYEALLAATIAELEDTYGFLQIRTEPAIRQLIDKALSRPGVTYVRRSNRVASR